MSDTTLPVYQFHRMTKDDFKEFVLALVDGRIYTSAQLRDPALLTTVFMPLVFGALSLPEEYAHLVPPYPPEPKLGEMPPEPVQASEPTLPPRPEPPAAPDVPEQLIRDVDWGRIAPTVLDPYAPLLQAHAEALVEWEGTILRAHEEACAVVVRDYETTVESHALVVAAWEAECAAILAAHEAEHARWILEDEVVAARYKEVMGVYLRDFGGVYEYLDKAGPRSINGCPIFMSCQLVHKEDWERGHKLARKEWERRQQLNLDLDDEVQDEPPAGY